MPFILAGRASISASWVYLHQWLTGERGVDPLVNVAINLVGPYVADVYWRDCDVVDQAWWLTSCALGGLQVAECLALR
jgi:hypothetical protein